MIFKMGQLEITVDPQIVVEVKMCWVQPVSSHPAKTGSTTRENYYLN